MSPLLSAFLQHLREIARPLAVVVQGGWNALALSGGACLAGSARAIVLPVSEPKTRISETLQAYRQARARYQQRMVARNKAFPAASQAVQQAITANGWSDLLSVESLKWGFMVEFGDGDLVRGDLFEGKAALLFVQRAGGLVGVYHQDFGVYAIGEDRKTAPSLLLELEPDSLLGIVEELLAEFVAKVLPGADIIREASDLNSWRLARGE